ncbi:type IV secretory system conjugative DNA transfer family protein [Nocardioides sp. Root140]|uniref:type IV secretory system conjugative DNA transfer family protein n=1 Tax=Nocardioides sp. Root140 TaxID=1736460 RepID=UPI0006FA4706|nr:TraM recognition domain-containing protein [Nocardioides sp. Root140]KQY61432.1 hypothetical protein ASD30_25575 [Nocardioides sp. Root140]
MARRDDLDATGRKDEAVAIAILVAILVGGLGFMWGSLHGAAALAGDPRPTANPARLLAGVVDGSVDWTVTATALAAAQVVGLVVVVLLTGWLFGKLGRRRQRVDRAARHLATGRDVAHLTRKGAATKAARLGLVDSTASPGVPLGRRVPSGSTMYSSWEDMIVIVAGPRTMKSTAYAIPAILSAPGAVLATSNKRDVVDVTRNLRTRKGEVWVFDPQGIAGEDPTWWWNPLTFIAPVDPATGRVKTDPATGCVAADEAKAERLAGQLVASAQPPGAKSDGYFDPEAENLIHLLLLAAAVGEHPITTVYSWLTVPTDRAPVELLRAHGFPLQQESLYALAHLPDKQREGVYGTARARLGWLRNRALVRWVTPPANPNGRQFHPAEFAASTGTLYPLSKEGEGSAGPLVAALTVAVVDALQERATQSPRGRLPVPFLAVLDEAANICRFRNLDSYYSYFGSMGIIMMTILQNWAQGEEVWGVKGMEKLWSAANVKVYGGGVDDDKFLRRLSDLIGPYVAVTRSTSVSGRGGRQHSRSAQERTILTIGDLRELTTAGKDGRGARAVGFASGTPPMLLEPQPWFITKAAREINASNTPELAAVHRTADPGPSRWTIGASTDDD